MQSDKGRGRGEDRGQQVSAGMCRDSAGRPPQRGGCRRNREKRREADRHRQERGRRATKNLKAQHRRERDSERDLQSPARSVPRATWRGRRFWERSTPLRISRAEEGGGGNKGSSDRVPCGDHRWPPSSCLSSAGCASLTPTRAGVNLPPGPSGWHRGLRGQADAAWGPWHARKGGWMLPLEASLER